MPKKESNRKRFDCVEMMHASQQAAQSFAEDKTLDEQLAYWHGAAGRLQAKIEGDVRTRAPRKATGGGARLRAV